MLLVLPLPEPFTTLIFLLDKNGEFSGVAKEIAVTMVAVSRSSSVRLFEDRLVLRDDVTGTEDGDDEWDDTCKLDSDGRP